MSPEQIQVKEVDRRSDLFSFGVLLYEMITSRLPFKADNEAATMNSVLNDSPEPLSRYKSDVPDDLQRIVSKLLEKDPGLRYQSAAGVISDLKRLSVKAAPVATKPKVDWWNRYVVPGAAVVLLAMAGYWMLSDEETEPTDASGRMMLAVLPFQNLGAPEDEYFADGITEEIISRLAAVRKLGVISGTSAYAYKETDKTVPQIARELGVDYVLEGSIRWDKTGDTDFVRITPRLIRVSDDVHLWADNFEKPLTQIFSLQIEISEQIVDALGFALGTTESEQLRANPTENLAAFSEYLKGRYHWNKRSSAGFQKAIEHFEQAIAIDSGYALAYSGLADAYSLSHGYGFLPLDESLPFAEKFARRALELDSTLAEAYTSLGQVMLQIGAYDSSGLLLARAVELNPNYATGHQWYANYLIRHFEIERPELVRVEIAKALELDPLSLVINSDYGYMYWLTGQVEEGISHLRNTIEMAPDFPNAHHDLAFALADMGQYEEAVTELLLAITSWGFVDSAEAHALQERFNSSGWEAFWADLFDRMNMQIEAEALPVSSWLLWSLRFDLREQTYYLLETELDRREPWLRDLENDPDFEYLHSDPKFQEILQRVKREFR
ncbi:MAG: hypothetical protein DRP45_04205 [Candidatus Zixiibacteriota bacterium]|nr:MAG: hypothetical protein DRP45_04205 [candidate division Zixibacteria bacterium]